MLIVRQTLFRSAGECGNRALLRFPRCLTLFWGDAFEQAYLWTASMR